MSKVEQIEAELKQLSAVELREFRGWLEDLVEDSLSFSADFESAVRESEREMAFGTQPRVPKR